MSIGVEVEEWAGEVWHRFITRRADPGFPEAQVELEDMQRSLAVLFRALGGAAGISVEASSARKMVLRRSLIQQVAGSSQQLSVAWADAENLRLPASLAVYPDPELNRDLYRWLALLAATSDKMRHWGRDNQRWTKHLLEQYPAMRSRYQRLLEAHLALRPEPDRKSVV